MDQSLQFRDVIKSSLFDMDFTSALSIGEILSVLMLTFLTVMPVPAKNIPRYALLFAVTSSIKTLEFSDKKSATVSTMLHPGLPFPYVKHGFSPTIR